MDALSDVLRVVRLKGGVFLNAEFTAPWCIFSQIGPEACGALLEGSDHLVIYHYVVEGRLAAQIPNGKPVETKPARSSSCGRIRNKRSPTGRLTPSSFWDR